MDSFISHIQWQCDVSTVCTTIKRKLSLDHVFLTHVDIGRSTCRKRPKSFWHIICDSHLHALLCGQVGGVEAVPRAVVDPLLSCHPVHGIGGGEHATDPHSWKMANYVYMSALLHVNK